MATKPSVFNTSRDMLLTLAVTIAVILVVVAPTGMCSFEPGRPENGPVREVDPAAFLRMETHSLGVPVRDPGVPEGWTPNSARRSSVGGAEAAVTGYLTSNEGYLQLTQTGADVDRIVDGRERTGSHTVAGQEVTEYAAPSRDERDLWVLDFGDARAVITGAAAPAEWEQLAAAVAAAPVV